MSQCPFGGDGEFSVRAVRRGLQRRPGQQPGQPLQPDALTMCVKYFDGRLDGADADRRDRRGDAGSTSSALVAELRELDRLVRVQRRPAADLARGPRRRPTATSRRPSRSSWPRPTSRPAEVVLVNLAECDPGRRDPDQAVPAADGRDVLPRVQLRGDDALGPGRLRRRRCSRCASRACTSPPRSPAASRRRCSPRSRSRPRGEDQIDPAAYRAVRLLSRPGSLSRSRPRRTRRTATGRPCRSGSRTPGVAGLATTTSRSNQGFFER